MATVPGLPTAVIEADGPPGLDDEDNLYGHHEDNEQPVEEGQVVDEDEENENPLAGDSDSEDEDIQVTIGDVAPTNVQFVKGPTAGTGAGKLDIDTAPILDGQTIYDMDLAQMEDRPWRKPGADLNDYFNYGFTEETWNMYCERQKKLRAEFGNNQAAVNKHLFGGINLSNPLAAVGTSVSHGYAGGVNRIQTTTTSTASGIPTLGNEVNKVLVDNGGNFHAGRLKEPVVRTVINPSQRAVPDFSKPPPILIPPAGVPNTSAPPPGVDAPPGVEDAPPGVGPPGTEDKPPGVQPTPLIDISMPPPGFNPNMPPPNMMGAGPPPARMMSLPPTNLPPPGFNVMLPPPGYPPTFGAPGTQPPGTQPPGTGMVRPLMDFDLARRESGEFAPGEEGDDDHRRRRHHRRSRSRSTGRSTRRRGEGSRTDRSERTDRDSERDERRRHRHRSRSGSKDREGRRKRESERKERSKRDEEGERKKRSRHDKDDDESRRDRDKDRDRDRKRSRRDDRDRERGSEREREFREEECSEKVADSQAREQDDGPPGAD